MTPYYADAQVTLYLGDCREVTDWLAADVLVTDPPYGRGWRRIHTGSGKSRNYGQKRRDAPASISGDSDTGVRDAALTLWGARLGIVFGDFEQVKPAGTAQRLIYRKAPGSGTHATHAGFRHDVECIYLTGPWPAAYGGRSSVIETSARIQASDHGITARYGHPHAKPIDVMETLIAACPPSVIADPFAGAGSTLVAARNLGRRAIGVELEERYAERAAQRLCQGVLIVGDLAAGGAP